MDTPEEVPFKERSPRGHRMVDTREQFEYVAGLYEAALLKERETNSKLRSDNANLRQKLKNRSLECKPTDK